MLVLSIGEPPQKFTWRYQKKKGKPSKPEILTPQQFYKKRIGIDLSQYVHLINDPTQPYQKHYRFDRSRNMIGGEDVHYINVEIDVLRDLAVKAICDNQPVLFGADARHDQDKIHGIMAVDIFDYQSLFGFDFRMSKAERMLTREITANHAMVFVGVDLVDGKPVKWRVENSWGKDLGKDGYWNLYDSWFDEYVFCLVVRKAYVPEKILERFDEEPIAMPPWHPLYELMR